MRPFLLLLLSCLIVSCQDDDDILMPTEPDPSPTDATAINYLALGDSYTIGTAVTADQRWPAQLADALATAGPDQTAYALDVDYVAVNGWTTGDLLAGIDGNAADLRETYDLVSLLIGVNNQFQGRPLAEYERQFELLLNDALRYADGDTSRVFVVSIPDYAFTPFGNGRADITAGVNAFNAAARPIAARYDIPFYNITPISRRGLDEPELVATDNLHPSGEQYRRWVAEVLAAPVRGLLAD